MMQQDGWIVVSWILRDINKVLEEADITDSSRDQLFEVWKHYHQPQIASALCDVIPPADQATLEVQP